LGVPFIEKGSGEKENCEQYVYAVVSFEIIFKLEISVNNKYFPRIKLSLLFVTILLISSH
jgi:hypothetical protein